MVVNAMCCKGLQNPGINRIYRGFDTVRVMIEEVKVISAVGGIWGTGEVSDVVVLLGVTRRQE
jgi:hypothetical protein